MDLSLVRLVLYLNLYVRKAHYIANFLNLRWSLSNIVLKIDIYLSISRPVYRYQESSNITLFTALDIAQYLCEYSWYSLILIKGFKYRKLPFHITLSFEIRFVWRRVIFVLQRGFKITSKFWLIQKLPFIELFCLYLAPIISPRLLVDFRECSLLIDSSSLFQAIHSFFVNCYTLYSYIAT